MGHCFAERTVAHVWASPFDLTHVMLFFLARLTATVFLVRAVKHLGHVSQFIHSKTQRLPAVDGLLDFRCFSSRYGDVTC